MRTQPPAADRHYFFVDWVWLVLTASSLVIASASQASQNTANESTPAADSAPTSADQNPSKSKTAPAGSNGAGKSKSPPEAKSKQPATEPTDPVTPDDVPSPEPVDVAGISTAERIARLNQGLASYRKRLDVLKGEFREEATEMDAAEQELAELAGELETVEKALESKPADPARLQELQQQQQDLDKQIKLSKARLALAVTAYKTLQNQITLVQQMIAQSQTAVDELKGPDEPPAEDPPPASSTQTASSWRARSRSSGQISARSQRMASTSVTLIGLRSIPVCHSIRRSLGRGGRGTIPRTCFER